jgi:HNH endonuclease
MPEVNEILSKAETDASLMVRFDDPRLPKRFWDKVVPLLDGCWQWMGGINRAGYGYFYFGGHSSMIGPIPGKFPTGLTVDHLCRKTGCVNPLHMELVSNRENTLRGEGITATNARKTHCKNGHPYDVWWSKNCGRACRACRVNENRKWRAEHQMQERAEANVRLAIRRGWIKPPSNKIFQHPDYSHPYYIAWVTRQERAEIRAGLIPCPVGTDYADAVTASVKQAKFEARSKGGQRGCQTRWNKLSAQKK